MWLMWEKKKYIQNFGAKSWMEKVNFEHLDIDRI
jgi:hypothetical protein